MTFVLKFSDIVQSPETNCGIHWKLIMVSFVRLDCVKELEKEHESSLLTLREVILRFNAVFNFLPLTVLPVGYSTM